MHFFGWFEVITRYFLNSMQVLISFVILIKNVDKVLISTRFNLIPTGNCASFIVPWAMTWSLSSVCFGQHIKYRRSPGFPLISNQLLYYHVECYQQQQVLVYFIFYSSLIMGMHKTSLHGVLTSLNSTNPDSLSTK